ncbi:ovochymase-like isoform X2 [Wyeomyia smithii]|uniref:ovochymase-like isoform X2 n=1 Tax=Wyeomyia smithii TaxID=174621 RepID=UPI002467DA57|nr:ovochymase-like isoform X2 [Wyeomyia smithii]
MHLPLILSILLFQPDGETIQVKSDQHQYRCGQRPIQSVGVITAGRTARPGEFPWHAAIYRMQQLGSSYICGGFLVSDRVLATAGHCVTDPENGFLVSASGLAVRLGMFEMLTVSRNTQEHRVYRIYRHENFTASSYRHDIALLILHTMVEFNAYVQPICLWDVERFGEGSGLVGFVTGWGLTEYDLLANVLKSAKIPMVGMLECLESDRDLFSQVLYEGMFCAGSKNGTNVCNGDSGGAFAINVNGTWVARGIISFTGLKENTASLCNPHSFAGFVNVASYLRWIEKIANQDRFVIVETFEANNSPNEQPTTISFTEAAFNSSERIKCAEYQSSSSRNHFRDLSYLAYVARDTPFVRVIDCFAIVISERFLISTAHCHSRKLYEKSSASAQIVIVETEGQSVRYEIENFHQFPAFIRTPSDENNLALIELGRNISIPTAQFVCLWSGGDPDMGKIFLYSAARDLSRRLGLDRTDKSAKCFNQLIAPSLMIQDSERDAYRLVGVVVNATCSKIRFVKLAKFISWIENLVWS